MEIKMNETNVFNVNFYGSLFGLFYNPKYLQSDFKNVSDEQIDT